MKKKMLSLALALAVGVSGSALGMQNVEKKKSSWSLGSKILAVAAPVCVAATVGWAWTYDFNWRKIARPFLGGLAVAGATGIAAGLVASPVEKKVNKLIKKVDEVQKNVEDKLSLAKKRMNPKNAFRRNKELEQSVLNARTEKEERERRMKELGDKSFMVRVPKGANPTPLFETLWAFKQENNDVEIEILENSVGPFTYENGDPRDSVVILGRNDDKVEEIEL